MASATPETKVILDRYELGAELGVGGMGAVYRAFDRERKKDVALKLLSSAGSVVDIARFKREFRAAARLSHPNCLSVFDLGSAGSNWFFTMEIADGGRLAPAPWQDHAEFVRLCLQTLRALDHLHSKRIVHRDLKPANILRAEGGVYKLSDFGIAKVADTEEDMETGDVLGSLPYMSPEQAAADVVDPRSDLYSLGVVFYELLSGKHPLGPSGTMSPRDWLHLHRRAAPKPLREVAPAVPEGLARIIDRLIEPLVERRYTSAAQVHREVVAWASAALPGWKDDEHAPLVDAGYLAAPKLVGRDAEVAAVDGALKLALREREAGPRVIMLSGPPGLGKSRLTNRALQIADDFDAMISISTCRAEAGQPYAGIARFVQLLDAVSAQSAVVTDVTGPVRGGAVNDQTIKRGADDGTIKRKVQDQTTLGQKAALAAPTDDATRKPVRPDAAPPSAPVAGGQWGYHKKIADQLLSRAQDTAFLCVIEDAQWADPATLELLMSMLRGAEVARAWGARPKVAFIVTHRTEANNASLDELIELLRSRKMGTLVALSPLSSDSACELVASVLMQPVSAQIRELVQKLAERERGNPLYLSQLLHGMVLQGLLTHTDGKWSFAADAVARVRLPASIHEAIGDRAVHLSSDTKDALACASVIGRKFSLAALRAVSQQEELRLLDCLDEAIRAGFVTEVASRDASYLFAHDRFREAIYERIPAEQKSRLHRAVAEALLSLGDTAENAADLAHHFAKSGENKRAFEFGTIAGRRAMKAYAYTRAAEEFTRAIDYAKASGTEVSVPVLEEAGDAYIESGAYPRAAETIAQCLERETNTERRRELFRKAAETQMKQGDFMEARHRYEGLLGEVGFRVPVGKLALGLRTVGAVLRFVASLLLPWLFVRKTTRDLPRERMISRVSARLAEAVYWMDFTRAVYYAFNALNVAEKIGPSPELVVAASSQGWAMVSLGNAKLGMKYTDRARAIAPTAPPADQAWQAVLESMHWAAVSDPQRHLEHAQRAETIMQRPEPMRLMQTLWTAGEAYLMLGRFDAAKSRGMQLCALAEEVHDKRGLGWGIYVLGSGELRRGDVAAAVQTLTRARDVCLGVGDLSTGNTAQARLAWAMALDGRVSEALALADKACRERERIDIRHISCMADGAYLAIAALDAAKTGRLADPNRVKRVMGKGKSVAKALAYMEPFFLAASAACRHVTGKPAAEAFDAAAKLAVERNIPTEAREVHLLAARILGADTDAGKRHAQKAAEILASFS